MCHELQWCGYDPTKKRVSSSQVVTIDDGLKTLTIGLMELGGGHNSHCDHQWFTSLREWVFRSDGEFVVLIFRRDSAHEDNDEHANDKAPFDVPSSQFQAHSRISCCGTSSSSYRIFEDCISPLVDAFFSGDNATVMAYGQTGSGKTYTMGTNYNAESNSIGIIPKVMESIFSKVEETKNNSEFLIRVSFIEVLKRSWLSHMALQNESAGSCTIKRRSSTDPRFDAINVIALVIREDDNDILDSFVLLRGDVAESCER
ncbi:hypothetical protein Syun_001274 [Stephania yunnanensis]|uniref:Kinesin motor domain-containing protein n=1 Tax=Stephania yunnanensis TaxID=152371 RepID=A0AAP0Q7K9_9MAGN